MIESLQIILFLLGYILISYFVITLITKWLIEFNIYLKLLLLSCFYALFWGIGIAGSGGGEPGFAIPAPNILALFLLFNNKFHNGFINGLYLFGFWWVLIFLFMLIRYLLKRI